jgi:hypothetical protein
MSQRTDYKAMRYELGDWKRLSCMDSKMARFKVDEQKYALMLRVIAAVDARIAALTDAELTAIFDLPNIWGKDGYLSGLWQDCATAEMAKEA